MRQSSRVIFLIRFLIIFIIFLLRFIIFFIIVFIIFLIMYYLMFLILLLRNIRKINFIICFFLKIMIRY